MKKNPRVCYLVSGATLSLSLSSTSYSCYSSEKCTCISFSATLNAALEKSSKTSGARGRRGQANAQCKESAYRSSFERATRRSGRATNFNVAIYSHMFSRYDSTSLPAYSRYLVVEKIQFLGRALEMPKEEVMEMAKLRVTKKHKKQFTVDNDNAPDRKERNTAKSLKARWGRKVWKQQRL
jgi:hypothetical protein